VENDKQALINFP